MSNTSRTVVKTVIGCLLFTMFVVGVVLVTNSAHTSQVREDGQRAIWDAVARMEKVVSSGNMNDLLSACNSGGGEVRCRQADYDITYRGHRILASQIAVDYHRVMHDKWDATSQSYLPYLTAIVQLEREPRLHYEGHVVIH